MMNRKWILKLLLVVLMASTISACRFGNYSDSPTQNGQVGIQSSELFSTDVNSLVTGVFYSDSTSNINQHAPLVNVPSYVLNTFTDPVYFLTLTDHTQFFWDIDQQNTTTWVTSLDSTEHINSKPGEAYGQFYHNANCMTYLQSKETGYLDRTNPTTMHLTGSSTLASIAGRLHFDIEVHQVFDGDCADDLAELAACYQDGTGCDVDQLARAKMFDLFVATGVLDIHNAAKINELAYIVHFE